MAPRKNWTAEEDRALLVRLIEISGVKLDGNSVKSLAGTFNVGEDAIKHRIRAYKKVAQKLLGTDGVVQSMNAGGDITPPSTPKKAPVQRTPKRKRVKREEYSDESE